MNLKKNNDAVADSGPVVPKEEVSVSVRGCVVLSSTMIIQF
jgi:hypothetical protein